MSDSANTKDLVARLRELEAPVAHEAADHIEHLHTIVVGLGIHTQRRLDEMEKRLEDQAKARAQREKKGRLSEIVGAIIAGIAFGAIFLFGAWWHGNFFAGLLYIAVGSGFVFLWELVSYAYRWWKSLRQTPNWRREETPDE
jgi:Flp pilus assembly protein TadB